MVGKACNPQAPKTQETETNAKNEFSSQDVALELPQVLSGKDLRGNSKGHVAARKMVLLNCLSCASVGQSHKAFAIIPVTSAISTPDTGWDIPMTT